MTVTGQCFCCLLITVNCVFFVSFNFGCFGVKMVNATLGTVRHLPCKYSAELGGEGTGAREDRVGNRREGGENWK